MTEPQGRRLTESRVAELHERIGELMARVEALERREDVGVQLARELGTAALRTLKPPPSKGRTT